MGAATCGRRTPDVPADLEAIVRKCVAADPTDRYQSAADLREDLERHLRNEPLKVAPDRRWESGSQKWRKRHPRFFAQVAVAAGVLAGLTLSVGTDRRLEAVRGGAGGRGAARRTAGRELAGLQADGPVRRLPGRPAARAVPAVTGGRTTPHPRRRDRQVRAGSSTGTAVPRRPELGSPARASPPCPTTGNGSSASLLSDACLFLARGHMQLAGTDRDRLTVAARYNALSEKLRGGPTPRAVLSQRAELHAKLNEKAVAEEAATRAEDTPLRTAEDHYLSANELLGQGQSADAVPLFHKALRLDPKHFWAHFGLGMAYHNLGRVADSRACYTAAIALRPDFSWAYYNRALAGIALRQYEDAVSDLDTAVELRPEYVPAVLHRAQAHEGAGNRRAAFRDLEAVLNAADTEGMHGRAYLLRSKYRRDDGDAAGAKADMEAGLAFTPMDETGWLIRGYAQLDTDSTPPSATSSTALKLNPNSIRGYKTRCTCWTS